MDHVTDMMQDLPWAPRRRLAHLESARPQTPIGLRGHVVEPAEPPAAPTAAALAALRAAVVPPSSPALRFEFKREYGNFYTNRGQQFVLREEHAAELRRLVAEHKRGRDSGTECLTLSDLVNCALDLALEHPAAFHPRVNPKHLRESLGREVMKKAYLRFLEHDPI